MTASPDGILDVSVTPPDGSVVLAGNTTLFTVKVTDLFTVLNASVIAKLRSADGEKNVGFLDLGTGGDVRPRDGIYSAEVVIPSSGTEMVLELQIVASGKDQYSQSFSYTITPAPPNDKFGDASKIPAVGGQILANNEFATIDGAEPLHAGVESVAHSLWWNWSPAEDGTVLLDSVGSTFDTVMAVYTGQRLGDLTEIASVNDVGSRQQGFLTFNAVRGRTYRIAIASVNEDAFGTIRVRLTPGGAPDTVPPNVTILSPPSGTVVRVPTVTVSGTASDPQPNASGISQVLVRVNTEIGASASGTTEWSKVVLLQQGRNEISAVSLDLSGNQSAPHTIVLTFQADDPVNDLFARATRLTGEEGSATGASVSAAKEFGEPLHGNNEGGRSIWWSWVAPQDGLFTVDTSGSNFDTLLGLYTGSRVNALTVLAQNDDSTLDVISSKVLHAVREGRTYRIAVDFHARQAALSSIIRLFHLGCSP